MHEHKPSIVVTSSDGRVSLINQRQLSCLLYVVGCYEVQCSILLQMTKNCVSIVPELHVPAVTQPLQYKRRYSENNSSRWIVHSYIPPGNVQEEGTSTLSENEPCIHLQYRGRKSLVPLFTVYSEISCTRVS
jgi:hypothetical protein